MQLKTYIALLGVTNAQRATHILRFITGGAKGEPIGDLDQFGDALIDCEVEENDTSCTKTGEECGLINWAGDDRTYCIKSEHCGTYGTWVAYQNNDSVEDFGLTCRSKGETERQTKDRAFDEIKEAQEFLTELKSVITPVSDNWLMNRSTGNVQFAQGFTSESTSIEWVQPTFTDEQLKTVTDKVLANLPSSIGTKVDCEGGDACKDIADSTCAVLYLGDVEWFQGCAPEANCNQPAKKFPMGYSVETKCGDSGIKLMASVAAAVAMVYAM